MRAMLSSVSSLAAAVLVAAVAHPAAAQQSTTSGSARPVAAPTTPGADAVLRTIATYRFVGGRSIDMPVQVTLADSAGALVASFRRAGGREAHPMLVTVDGADVVLAADTPAGQLALRLVGLNDFDAPRRITGRWSLGAEQGELRGRSLR